MKRKIIRIDARKCNGCGQCIPNCPEGAIQIIDGKARLISDLFCDGLGACLGHCPTGAITIEEREAELYDETRVMANIIPQGANVIAAHLRHLAEHGQKDYLAQALAVLDKEGIANPLAEGAPHARGRHGGCPGARSIRFEKPAEDAPANGKPQASALTHWPIQLHLMSPTAPQYQGRDIVLAADCTAYALGSFHRDYLSGRALAIACPKLDSEQQIYVEKIRALIDEAKINTLTVIIMQVPCCRGLLALAQEAARQAGRKVPIKCVVVGLQGKVLQEDWV